MYSFVGYLYVSGSGSITSVGEERELNCLLVIIWFLLPAGEVSSSSGCLGWVIIIMELEELRVYVKKVKLMVSGPGLDLLRDSDAFLCAVCRSGDGGIYIECWKCKLLV